MRRVLIVLIAFLPLLGCAKKRALNAGSVSGTITYKGNPVNGALLRFYPVPGPDPEVPAVAADQQGKFTATIPPGEYKIAVQGSPGPPKGVSEGGGMVPKGMDPAKAEEMRKRLAGIQGDMPAATISFPNKYKSQNTTDLTAKIVKGDNTLNLELKD
jgi:hypothetical protein